MQSIRSQELLVFKVINELCDCLATEKKNMTKHTVCDCAHCELSKWSGLTTMSMDKTFDEGRMYDVFIQFLSLKHLLTFRFVDISM